MSRLRVVIADDQPLMRAGFRTVLEATGSIEVVGEAGDGEEAIRAAEAHRPDVVLMDIRMPGMDGIEATRRLPRQRVLILTTFGLDEYIVEALRAGASGFLTKDAPAARARRGGPGGRRGRRRALARRSRAGCSTASRAGCPRAAARDAATASPS